MKLELPKVALEIQDLDRLHDLLGMAWRAKSSTLRPDEAEAIAEVVSEVAKAAEVIAQGAFMAGVEYGRKNSC